MNRLNRDQKAAVGQFLEFCPGVKEAAAIAILTKHKWKMDAAIDDFFNNPPDDVYDEPVHQVTRQDSVSLDSLWNTYADRENGPDSGPSDRMSLNNIARFYEDLGISMEDVVSIVVACKVGGKGRHFEKADFIANLGRMGCTSINSIKQRLPAWLEEVRNPMLFKPFFLQAFVFFKEQATHKQIMLSESADLLSTIYKDFKFLPQWTAFAQAHPNRVISDDAWHQLYDFSCTINSTTSNYDSSAAWPTIIDDFVDFVRASQGQDPTASTGSAWS